MPTAIMYHIYLKPKADVTTDQVQAKINLALDWFKYGDNCWIVESTSDVAKWQTRLKPLVDPAGYFFICKIDISVRQGWMSKSFWEWLKGKKKPAQ